jgi:glycogen debranching enzyme
MENVKAGLAPAAVDLAAEAHSAGVGWRSGATTVRLDPGGAEVDLGRPRELLLVWPLTVPARGITTVSWTLSVEDEGSVVVAPVTAALDARSLAAGLADRVAAAGVVEPRLRPWLERSLSDLNSLRMATAADPGDTFFAAGAPWYLTLFGRDSLWTARMLLPLDVEHAGWTLRVLARLQGTTTDPGSAEAPGKIMHELRRGQYAFGETSLPPLYYGTIDATPLWVCLLHDAWRAGLAPAAVEELLPALESALDWLSEHGDADGDGFCEYVDESGRGLANQGWKDSADAVRFADGSQAVGPVALCEVQGYAYEAAMSGAALLEAFSRPGAARHREWAAQLAARFRDQFWCGSGEDRYPALALDGHKQRVDSVTSNIGHLVGTGLLSTEEELLVARRLARDDLDSGLGLRTMSALDGGYSPLSYHCGSVWPHDTAIVVRGLVGAGLLEHAAGLVEGLLAASVAFDQRLPELWSGEGRPVPYPAACRPQAWSAAAAVVVGSALARGDG